MVNHGREGMVSADLDSIVRNAAFAFLREHARTHGPIIEWEVLKQGFTFNGEQVHLVSMQGIFKPKQLDTALTIRTGCDDHNGERPYDDGIDNNGVLHYRYQGDDPTRYDNQCLKAAARLRQPLIYFAGLVPGKYRAFWPVYVTGDLEAELTFMVDLQAGELPDSDIVSELRDEGVEYGISQVRRRLHQDIFRERVISAYRSRCAICKLRHGELLDAAHIRPAAEEGSTTRVSNGMSLCKLHHAAFDQNFIGITPDYVVELRQDLLDEEDGPMLQYGIQAFHNHEIIVPRPSNLKPDKDLLAERYDRFRNSA